MVRLWIFRSLPAALVVAWLGLALPGCVGSAPTKSDKKKDDKPDPKPGSGSNTDPSQTTDSKPPQSTLAPLAPDAEKAATAFLTALAQGKATAEMLSTTFAKAVGKPVELPSDKAKGYSPDMATDWLRKVGEGVTIGLPTQQHQAGDVVLIRGTLSGTRLGKDTGGYSLRLVKQGGAWKVDWLTLTSVEVTAIPSPPATAEVAAQDFAAVAFAETVADLHGMPHESRAPLVAAAVAPPVRAAWAPPFNQDKPQGYDYNPATINRRATAIGGGTSSLTVTRVGADPVFTVVFTKPAGKKSYTVKLVKGSGPYEWLVAEATEQKG